jgi:large subunit ribosomal protein L4
MKLTLDIHSVSGKKEGQLDLPAHIFQAKINPVLVAQAVRVYLHNQRQGSAFAKDRGDVEYTKAKAYRQKGTGRARHGARSAPIFVGGGVAHGPSETQNYSRKMSKPMRRQALYSVLTEKYNQQAITVVKGLEKLDGKTKTFAAFLKTLNLPLDKPVLLMLDKPHQIIIRAARGLTKVHTTQVKRLNTYEVLNHAHLIITPDSVDSIADIHPQTEKKAVVVEGNKE